MRGTVAVAPTAAAKARAAPPARATPCSAQRYRNQQRQDRLVMRRHRQNLYSSLGWQRWLNQAVFAAAAPRGAIRPITDYLLSRCRRAKPVLPQNRQQLFLLAAQPTGRRDWPCAAESTKQNKSPQAWLAMQTGMDFEPEAYSIWYQRPIGAKNQRPFCELKPNKISAIAQAAAASTACLGRSPSP